MSKLFSTNIANTSNFSCSDCSWKYSAHENYKLIEATKFLHVGIVKVHKQSIDGPPEPSFNILRSLGLHLYDESSQTTSLVKYKLVTIIQYDRIYFGFHPQLFLDSIPLNSTEFFLKTVVFTTTDDDNICELLYKEEDDEQVTTQETLDLENIMITNEYEENIKNCPEGIFVNEKYFSPNKTKENSFSKRVYEAYLKILKRLNNHTIGSSKSKKLFRKCSVQLRYIRMSF